MSIEFLLSALVLFLVSVPFWLRRQRRLLAEENAVRRRLGLPELTRGQFAMQVEEKSAEFRHNINQHM